MGKSTLNKAIIFDAGTLITFSMNGLTEELRKLKSIFDGAFLITQQVKSEIIDKPLTIKQFELEAMRAKKLFDDGILELADTYGFQNSEIEKKANEIMSVANSLFRSSKENVTLIHFGESSCIALSKMLLEKSIKNVIAIDERTTRMLIEKPENLKDLLERKLHTHITLIKKDFAYFGQFRTIRSAELIYVLWKRGLTELKGVGNSVLDALLYAVKSKGCSISDEEIAEIKAMK